MENKSSLHNRLENALICAPVRGREDVQDGCRPQTGEELAHWFDIRKSDVDAELFSSFCRAIKAAYTAGRGLELVKEEK